MRSFTPFIHLSIWLVRPEPGPLAVFVVFDFFGACVLEEDSAAMPPCMRFAMQGFEGGLSALTLDDLSALGTGGPAAIALEDDDDAALTHDAGV